jgi:hypothetical protein
MVRFIFSRRNDKHMGFVKFRVVNDDVYGIIHCDQTCQFNQIYLPPLWVVRPTGCIPPIEGGVLSRPIYYDIISDVRQPAKNRVCPTLSFMIN